VTVATMRKHKSSSPGSSSKGHQAAYSFDGSGAMRLWGAGDQSTTSAFRHKDAVYVLPSENEWVKAAYWNGSALQTYATPGDTLPASGGNRSQQQRSRFRLERGHRRGVRFS
jgi:hypothetical protein